MKRVVALLAMFGVWAFAGQAGAQHREPPLPIDPDHVGPVGWPVWPVDAQHPIRGGFLDPRPTTDGVMFHNGVDISVRDDEPEPDHPWYRTHRVYALEGGTVEVASDCEPPCVHRSPRAGRPLHVQPSRPGRHRRAR